MNDRELLELAAKAADYLSAGLFWDEKLGYLWDGEGFSFDPLSCSDDAFCLALKLGLCIQPMPECDTVQVYQIHEFTGEPFNTHVAANGDIEARRCIVEAAAEIGRLSP